LAIGSGSGADGEKVEACRRRVPCSALYLGVRVVRLMRLDNLLALRRSGFVATTDSDHELLVHLNLAGRMQLSGINQLWVADITFVKLQQEFVYLAVILDAFSRKVVGWALDRSLAAQLAITALQNAIRK